MELEARQYEVDSIVSLCDRAASDLACARDQAELLEAGRKYDLAYDLAKKARRLESAVKAHDEGTAALLRVQARALEGVSQMKLRLAEEYDAAQEAGEVRRAGNPNCSGTEQLPGPDDLGLTRKQIHEARQFRDAEAAEPGIISRTINDAVERGDEPTKAALRRSVIEAAERALLGRGQRTDRRNRDYKPDAAFDAVAGLNGSCRRILDLVQERGGSAILDGCTDQAMRARTLALIEKCRDSLTQILELRNV